MAKVCAVVGVGPGVGLAIARRFAAGGFDLVLVARRADPVKALAAELAGSGSKAQAFPADASDVASLKRALATIATEMGPPEVLVYNAAGVTPGAPSAVDGEQVVRDFRVSVIGALVAAQAVIPAMRAAKRGTILFTGGGFAFEPLPAVASLGIGKAGIRNLAFSLAKELEPEGIHVATVTIGGVVKAGTAFDPAAIADEFWKLHVQPAGQFQRETVFRPAA
jgi:NAD(P)-dependent dehydrogenase (short-subunit alcohol dehydrogenase family)